MNDLAGTLNELEAGAGALLAEGSELEKTTDRCFRLLEKYFLLFDRLYRNGHVRLEPLKGYGNSSYNGVAIRLTSHPEAKLIFDSIERSWGIDWHSEEWAAPNIYLWINDRFNVTSYDLAQSGITVKDFVSVIADLANYLKSLLAQGSQNLSKLLNQQLGQIEK